MEIKKSKNILIIVVIVIGMAFIGIFLAKPASIVNYSTIDWNNNVLTNGDFENGDLTGWNGGSDVGTSPAVHSDSRYIKTGNYGLKLCIYKTVGSTSYQPAWIEQTGLSHDVKSDTVLSFYAWIYGGQSVKVTVEFTSGDWTDKTFSGWKETPREMTFDSADIGRTVKSIKIERIGSTTAHTAIDSIYFGEVTTITPTTTTTTITPEDTTTTDGDQTTTDTTNGENGDNGDNGAPAFGILVSILSIIILGLYRVKKTRLEKK